MQKSTILLFSFLLTLLFLQNSCITIDNQFTAVAPGPWRAVLKLDANVIQATNPQAKPLPGAENQQFEEVMDGELPFVFEVKYENETDFYIEIINGEERIKVDDIIYGRDRATAKDTIVINFPLYESYITAIYEEDVMEGKWVVTNRENYSIPFVAFHGKNHRFTTLKKEPALDVSGKWEVTFGLDEGKDPYPAIGEFVQKGNYVTGTFLTETGDYRFLEGTIQANKLYLSVFDGSHAFLFEAKIQEDSTMIGSFRSGKHYRTIWEAKRNPDVILTDPNELTFIKEGYEGIAFSFENTDGKMVSLEDEKYQNKVKIVQIMGTWCPNCRDETNFLVDYLKKNDHPDLEIISLAFEKHRSKEKAQAAVKTYKEKLNIPYEILIAGYYNKKEAGELLPMLNHVLSYPTMIFIDRNNEVRKIHTGFSGPATSKYAPFTKEFQDFTQQLLQE